MSMIQIGEYTLTGGGMCPEQYDVFKGDVEVAYLRLRHGEFTAELTKAPGVDIYTAYPNGDGFFDDDERDRYLAEAIKAVDDALTAPLADLGGKGR